MSIVNVADNILCNLGKVKRILWTASVNKIYNEVESVLNDNATAHVEKEFVLCM